MTKVSLAECLKDLKEKYGESVASMADVFNGWLSGHLSEVNFAQYDLLFQAWCGGYHFAARG